MKKYELTRIMIYIGSPNGEKLFKNLIQNYRAELRNENAWVTGLLYLHKC